MEDDEINLFNVCTDLVSLRKAEAFPLHLLQSERSGTWVCVREVCRQLGIACGELGAEVFATWLADPKGHDDYAIILFYDDELKWSMAAHYNRARLRVDGTKEALQSTAAAPSVGADANVPKAGSRG